MTAPIIHIRHATPVDLDTAFRFNEAMAWETESRRLDRATVAEGVRNALADPNRCIYFVAEFAGSVVGQTMITFEWSDWRNGFFWWIQSVYVDPDHRRQGVFRALYDHIRTEAKTRPDVCGLRLYVYHSNDRAIATYQTLGMSVADYKLCVEDWSADAGVMD